MHHENLKSAQVKGMGKRALPAVALVLLLCVFVSQCFFIPGCKSRRQMARFLTEQGKKQMKTGDKPGAISYFSNAVMFDPNYAPAYYHRAQAEFDLGDYESAAGDFGTAAALFRAPKDKAKAYCGKASALRVLGKRKQAHKNAENAVNSDFRCPECYYCRGQVRADSGDYDGAIEDFGRCLKLAPDFHKALMARAKTLMHLRRYRKAIKDLERYSKLLKEPQPSILVVEGYARWGLNDMETARKLFNEAEKKFPDTSQPKAALGKLELKSQKLKTARELFNKSIWTTSPSPEAYLNRCVVELLQDDLSTAYEDCVRARIGYRIFPEAGRAMLFSWTVQSRRGQLKRAQDAVKDFIEAAKPVEWRLPILKFAAGEITGQKLLASARKIKAGGDNRMCETFFVLAQSKLNEEDIKTAAVYLRRAVKVCPPYSLERLAADYELTQIK